MNLYGHEMDETVSPLQAGMGWTIAWEPAERDFIGRKALEAQSERWRAIQQVGLVLQGKRRPARRDESGCRRHWRKASPPAARSPLP